MAHARVKHKAFGPTLLAVACIVVAIAVAWALFGKKIESQARGTDAQTTGSLATAPTGIVGGTGLPIPRFVSLKAEKVNVRVGPSSEHPVAWVFQRKSLPVEIVAESDNWRLIRDSDGQEGWILQSMLAGKRTAVVAPWKAEKVTALQASASASAKVIANLASGAMANIEACDGAWCKLSTNGYEGYVQQEMLWGVYAGEIVK